MIKERAVVEIPMPTNTLDASRLPQSTNMIKSPIKSDGDIKNDVLDELRYEPGIDVTHIGVLVRDGVVTLNGTTQNYGEKWEAVIAAKRVFGVTAVADDIEIKLDDPLNPSDGEIASAAAHQLEWTPRIEAKTVQITVRQGWVTLEGEVERWFQKNLAEHEVRNLKGVKGISNLISIKPRAIATGVEMTVRGAFRRSAMLVGDQIQIEVDVNRVTLRGKVRNHYEKEEAARLAWAAPGVASVDNHLNVNWYEE